MDHINQILGFIFLLAGPCALVFSLVSLVRTKSFLRHSVEVTGEVIRLECEEEHGGRMNCIMYSPVFSFTVADGNTYTVTSKISSSPPDFSIGESVRVRYDPANPQGARIHTFFETWGAAVISGGVGVGFIAFGCKLLGLFD